MNQPVHAADWAIPSCFSYRKKAIVSADRPCLFTKTNLRGDMNRTSRWSEPVRSVLAKCFSGRAAGVRLLLIFLCALFAAQATPGGYSYYRPITIDHTKVPYLD